MTMLGVVLRTALLAFAWLLSLTPVVSEGPSPLTCSLSEEEQQALDPNLKEMTVILDGEEQTFLAYVQPSIESMYNGNPPASEAVEPMFNGHAAKFINLSNKALNLYWEPFEGGDASLMRLMPPFYGSGTASFPGHRFFFSDPETPNDKLILYIIDEKSLYVYDPYEVPGDEEATKANLARLDEGELHKYKLMKRSLLFSEEYKKVTGRDYLVNFPRPRPTHFMWPAEYFGQEHWTTTRETHFASQPPPEELQRIKEVGSARILADSDPRLLADYRVPNTDILNLTLRVLSVAPRVLEIPNFLSQAEVDHILELAAGEDMHLSRTGQDGPGSQSKMTEAEKRSRRTRTSFNSWVERERTPVIDAVYRRAADLLHVDEALLRVRSKEEYPDLGTKKSIGESLQLVHYNHAQEYTAHHDFGYSEVDATFQKHRFSTLLFYLNEGMTGGATTFPRWVNAESFEELRVEPVAGKAVLFYSQLPDGNMDDLSQHAAKPVWDGEKFLINLWMWDPVYE